MAAVLIAGLFATGIITEQHWPALDQWMSEPNVSCTPRGFSPLSPPSNSRSFSAEISLDGVAFADGVPRIRFRRVGNYDVITDSDSGSHDPPSGTVLVEGIATHPVLGLLGLVLVLVTHGRTLVQNLGRALWTRGLVQKTAGEYELQRHVFAWTH